MNEGELLAAVRLPLLILGARANAIREAAFGDRVYFAAHPSPAFLFVVPSNATPEQIAAALVSADDCEAIEPRVQAVAGDTTGELEIRLIALARVALPPEVHVRANWAHLTDAVAQVALRFGADELAGFPADLDHREITRAIREAGREPYPCDAAYLPVELPEPAAKLRVLPVA